MIQSVLERILIPSLRMLLQLFFRKIEIVNVDNVPVDAPIIFTANHTNSLIDGMLVRAFLPNDPRALAKATLWNHPMTKALVEAANCIPVHRQSDAKKSGHQSGNQSMFKSCGEALAQNNSIVLFPEGTSHDEPELLPLKTGAARIALSAEQQHGPLAIRIVPVGLIFDNKEKFRSQVLIYIGEAIDPVADIDVVDVENRDQVNAVTSCIEEGIKSVTLNYPSWTEANIINRAADIYQSQQQSDSSKPTLLDEFSLQKKMADAYPVVKATSPRTVSRVINAVKSYDRLLRILSIQHDHFIQDRPGIITTISSIPKLSLFLIRLPLALLGLAFNIMPVLLTRAVGLYKMPANRTSTVKIFSGLFLYPICWTVQANILGQGLMPTWYWWLLAPLSGAVSILFLEHHSQWLDELRAYIRLQTQSDVREELEERLDNVNREVAEFIEVALTVTAATANEPDEC